MSEELQTSATPEVPAKPERNTTLWVLSIFSLVYLGGLTFFFFQTAPCVPDWWGPQSPRKGFVDTFIKCRTSNEIGDFLAGAFAPLAFLWLAGAVLIQSRELKAQKDELTLTRAEMAAMREVATAQAAEARASKEFIGKQTEIMQLQAAREELDDVHEELEAFIRTFEACLKRFRFEIDGDFGFAEIHRHLYRLDNDLPVDVRIPDLIERVKGAIKHYRDLLLSDDVKPEGAMVLGSFELFDVRDSLLDLLPKLGAAGRARFAEQNLATLLDQVHELQLFVDANKPTLTIES